MNRLKLSIFTLGLSLSFGVLPVNTMAESTLDSTTGAERDFNRPSTNGSPNIQDCNIRNGNDRLLCERQMQNDAARVRPNDNSRINGNNQDNMIDESRSRDTLSRDRQLRDRQLQDRLRNDQLRDGQLRDRQLRDSQSRDLETRDLGNRDLDTRNSVDRLNDNSQPLNNSQPLRNTQPLNNSQPLGNTQPLSSTAGDVPLNSNPSSSKSNNSGTGTSNGF